jgi:uncharacterized oxidoreductase
MDITSRTILIVGGTSGLGLALAERLSAEGSRVVVAGRRPFEHASIDSLTVDVTDPASIEALRDAAVAAYPELDTVVTMSGIMEAEDLRSPAHLEVAERTVVTNLLGTIRLATAFTPHLVARGAGTIVTVSSGIGFVPFPLTPTYGATKAGVHSYSESLREQLRGTGVGVVELVPPHVATTLMGMQDAPSAMPVAEFTDEVVALLAQEPTPDQVLVERVRGYLTAREDGTYAERVAQNAGLLSMLRPVQSAAV